MIIIMTINIIGAFIIVVIIMHVMIVMPILIVSSMNIPVQFKNNDGYFLRKHRTISGM